MIKPLLLAVAVVPQELIYEWVGPLAPFGQFGQVVVMLNVAACGHNAVASSILRLESRFKIAHKLRSDTMVSIQGIADKCLGKTEANLLHVFGIGAKTGPYF